MHIVVLFIVEEKYMNCKEELKELIENIEREDIITYLLVLIKKIIKAE